MNFYKHFEFFNGSNPYITFTAGAFLWMINNYNITIINNDFMYIDGPKKPAKTYKEKKEALREFAIYYQSWAAGAVQSWAEVASWADFFDYAGRRFGLLSEFKENCIC